MLNSYIKNLVANRHVAGSRLENALEACEWASSNGWSTTISLWTNKDEDKKSAAEKYIKILNTISKKSIDSYLSIKPSSLQFNPELFERIVKALPDKGTRIHFDSLSPDLAEKSLQFFKQANALYGNVGYTIPARWLRSFNDAEEIAMMNVPVRVVKGQWHDNLTLPNGKPSVKIDVRENFLNIIRMLINKVPLIAIATHDLRLARESIGLLQNTKTDFELEQFFSLPMIGKKLQSCFDGHIIKIRLYIAYGEPYLPYNLRNAMERPAMIKWFIKDIILKKQKFNFRFNRAELSL